MRKTSSYAQDALGTEKLNSFTFKLSATRVCDAWHETAAVTAGSSGQRRSDSTCNYTDMNEFFLELFMNALNFA